MEKQQWVIAEIAGFEVFDTAGEKLGSLQDVIRTGGHDIWIVQSDDAAHTEILVPATAGIITEVNRETKRITMALPAGLREIYSEPEAPKKKKKWRGKWHYKK